MGSASAHRVGSDRAQFTVAELLGRYGSRSAEIAGIDSLPAGWPAGAATPRRRLVLATGAVVAVGSLVCGAALCGQQPRGGPMGSESAEGGHPAVERPGPAPRAVAPATPRRVTVTSVTRTSRVDPSPRRVPRRSTPTAVPVRPPRISDSGTVRSPAGSALSGLTPSIGPVDALGSLLGGLR